MPSCEIELTADELAGALFIHRRTPELYRSNLVTRGVRELTGTTVTQPERAVALWLRSVEANPETTREHLYRAILTRKVTESFFELQRRLALERGQGYRALSRAARAELERLALADQKRSLDEWIDYFAGPDTRQIPLWMKYWMLSSVVRLGSYNVQRRKFDRRSRGQAAMFPELNREALDVVKDRLGRARFTPANFATWYGEALLDLASKTRDLTITSGVWRKFDRGSDPAILSDALVGWNTGWCTAGVATADYQLGGGDFYVYFSEDAEGRARVPRLAIRMSGSSIQEVRGVGRSQHLDEAIAQTEILDAKLDEFGASGDRYRQGSADMKRVTELHRRPVDAALSTDELRFIWEVDRSIHTFGYNIDPRIRELQGRRDIKADMVAIHGNRSSADQVSLTKNEALRPGMEFHVGELDLNGKKSPRDLFVPRYISGSLFLHQLEDLKRFRWPERVDGAIVFGVKKIAEVHVPTVKADIHFERLKKARALTFVEVFDGGLSFDALKSFEGVKLPRRMTGWLTMYYVKTLAGGRLPDYVGGDLTLTRLADSDLVLPRFVGGNVNLGGLTVLRGVTFPDHVGGTLMVRGNFDATGAFFGSHVGGDFKLRDRLELVDVQMPETVGGEVVLRGVNRLRNVVFPKSIGGNLVLNDIEDVENVTWPQKVGGEIRIATFLPLITDFGDDYRDYEVVTLDRLHERFARRAAMK